MIKNEYNWYIVHVLANSEKKVMQSIREQASKKNLSDYFQEIVIPTEKFIEIRRGKKIDSEKKVLPGYILIKMKMNDTTWHIVKDIAKVTGFLGIGGKAQPVSERNIEKVLQQIQESTSSQKYAMNFEIGESVKIIDGPFNSFVGSIEEIDEEKSRLKISVSIFGRYTPVELDYTQVTKDLE